MPQKSADMFCSKHEIIFLPRVTEMAKDAKQSVDRLPAGRGKQDCNEMPSRTCRASVDGASLLQKKKV